MESGKYILLMAEFITGNIDFSKFDNIIEDRLFELRQNAEMTEEQKILSSIELYLHEAEEGLRTESEVYAIVQFMLDNIILTKLTSSSPYFSPTTPNLPYLLSKDVVDKRKTETQDLLPANSK